MATSANEYRGTHIVDESKNVAWEVADFLFGAKSIKKILSGEGTWGDAATVGITAATFFIPPAKLSILGSKTLAKVLDEAAAVDAVSDSLPIVAKAAKKTRIQVEAELVRRGKLTYGKTPEPELPSQPMSQQRFESITGAEPKGVKSEAALNYPVDETSGLAYGKFELNPSTASSTMSTNRITPSAPRPTPKRIAERIEKGKNNPLALYFDDAMEKHIDKLRLQLSSGSTKIEDLSQDNQYLLEVFSHFDNPKNFLGYQVVWVKAKDATDYQIKNALKRETRKTKSGDEEWVQINKRKYKPYTTPEPKGNSSAPTEPEVSDVFASIGDREGLSSPRTNMGPASNPVEFVDDYLDKLTTYKSLAQQLKDAKGATAFRRDVKELKDDEKNLALRKENRSAIEDPENPNAVTPITEINDQLIELQAYFKKNHKFFTKLYDDVYGDETVATIRSYAAVAAGKQGAITPEEKLIASLPISQLRKRPQPSKLSREATEVRKRVDKQDEILTAQENKQAIDFEVSTFQGGTNLKADSDFTPQLTPKQTSLAPDRPARADWDELQEDLRIAKYNLIKPPRGKTSADYEASYDQALKAIKDRTKLSGLGSASATSQQEQKILADTLFKIQDLRVTVKRTTSTPKGTPPTRNVADRARHVENIIARESKDFVEGSQDYVKQLKNKKEFKNDDGTLNVEKYEKRMQEYQDEIDTLRKMQDKAWKTTKELSKKLNDTGIRTFMNRVATNKIDPINRQALIDLIDDLAEQAKDPALKKRIINYVNKLRSQEGIDKTASRKAAMNTRLAKEDAARKARFEAKKLEGK